MTKQYDEEFLHNMRHTLAHLLAAAVRDLYPGAKNAIGPSIEHGFYQDFDLGGHKISDDDLPKIEQKMRELLKQWTAFERREVTSEEAKEEFAWNEYKTELIDEFAGEGKSLTFYTVGGFVDLCRGGHLERPAQELPAAGFTLDRVAGAYWRGDEKNPMLTRIYGLAFASKQELDAYRERMEAAKQRDHRKLGKELDLFTFSPLVGAGLPLWTPKGTVLRTKLQEALSVISQKYDMLPVTIPHIAKRALYKTSGHAEKFGDELIEVVSHYDTFVMKPVNCPHHIQIYKSKPHNYRNLPLRYMESTMQYRDEKPGEIGGLTRVRSITVDDGHIFCRVDQIKEESKRIAHIIEEFYTGLGLFGNHWVSLSVRDPKTPEKYIGLPEDWDSAERMLQEISDELGLEAKRREGEAALYGPKLDYIFKDSLGREWQLATIQIDFAMPKRFELSYTDTNGEERVPVILHRAILGSYERFLAILIEHFAGKFPLWLSPVQVKILPIADRHTEYAADVAKQLKSAGYRIELDDRQESVGKKIRNAQLEHVPYMLVVGDKEIEAKQVAVRSRDEGDLGVESVEQFIERLKQAPNPLARP